MNEFLVTALSFPTVVFSVLLTVCTVYWLLAATGLVDVDALDGLLGVDGDATDASGAAAVLAKLGLAGVPVMLLLTVLAFVGWLSAYFVHLLLLAHLPDGLRLLAGVAVDIAVLVPGVFVTALLLRPVSRWLHKLRPADAAPILGRTAIVRTAQVTGDYGTATVDDGGAGLILQVRHDGAGQFTRGDRVVLIEYLESQHAYRVMSEQQFLSL